MKTATLPSLRVDPALRQAAEAVLQKGETLSSFVEQSVRAQVQLRQQQEAFIARGLAARESARRSGKYTSAHDILESLKDRLDQAREA
jgi:predicted transcriptional regulator